MILRSPIAALLWENWRLTRIEAAQRLGLGIVAGSGVFLAFGAGQAFWIIVLVNAFFYMSIAKLNGGRFLDGYKPGFPLYLLYTRPVSTSAFVGVAVAYDAISGALMYLVHAALLMFAFGLRLPLFSIALVILVYHLAYICIQWSTQSRTIQWIGSVVITLPAFFFLREHAADPSQFHLSPTEAGLVLLFGIVSVAFTIVGVARQRRGDAVAVSRPATAGYPDWLLGLLRYPCPTSSAGRAQMWFELRSSGLPALAVGLGLGILIFLLFALGTRVEFARWAAFLVLMLSGPLLITLLGGNAFGIRRRQGRAFTSAFEMTQPCGIPQLAGVKILVRTACLLAGLVIVASSAWASSSLLNVWEPWVMVDGKDAVPGFLELREEIGDALAGLSLRASIVVSVIVSVTVATFIAILAAFSALRARFQRRMIISGSVVLGYGLLLILLAVAGNQGALSGFLVGVIFMATGCTLVASLALATLYLFRTGLAERALTPAYAAAVVLVSAAFGAAWTAMLTAAGVNFGALPAVGVVAMTWPVLLPLLAGSLAPWSLSRLRHL